MSFGPSGDDIRRQQEAQAAAAKAAANTPMPDLNDAAIRQARADAMKDLLSRRGRSSTIFNHASGSGRLADQNGSPMKRKLAGRRP